MAVGQYLVAVSLRELNLDGADLFSGAVHLKAGASAGHADDATVAELAGAHDVVAGSIVGKDFSAEPIDFHKHVAATNEGVAVAQSLNPGWSRRQLLLPDDVAVGISFGDAL